MNKCNLLIIGLIALGITPEIDAATKLKTSGGAGFALLEFADQSMASDVFWDIGIELHFNRYTRIGLNAIVPDTVDNQPASTSSMYTQQRHDRGLDLASQLYLQQQLIGARSYRLYGTVGLSRIFYQEQSCSVEYSHNNDIIVGTRPNTCAGVSFDSRGINFGFAVEPNRLKPLRLEYIYINADNNVRLQLIRAGISF